MGIYLSGVYRRVASLYRMEHLCIFRSGLIIYNNKLLKLRVDLYIIDAIGDNNICIMDGILNAAT